MAAIFVAAIVPNNHLNAKSMIRYKKYESNQTGVTKNKWYGRAVTELMEFEEFVKHMANHHCVFGESTIRGVLIEMQICMRELLLEGKAVRLDDLGIFRIGLETSAAITAKELPPTTSRLCALTSISANVSVPLTSTKMPSSVRLASMMVAATMAARLPTPTMRAAIPVAATPVAAICRMAAALPKIQTILNYSNGFCN